MPKITIGDPTKLITKPIEGITNAIASVATNTVGAVGGVANSAVGVTGEVLSNSVAQVGNAMSQDGAGAVLGGLGAAFGLPTGGLMGLASGFMGQSQASTPEASQFAQPQTVVLPNQASQKSDIGMIAMIGGGLVAVILVIVLLNKGKK